MEKVIIQLCDRIIHSKNDRHHLDIQLSRDVIYGISDIILEKGRIYGILCKCGEGGQGITNLLTGNEYIAEEKICIDDKLYKEGERVREGWNMGQGIRKPFIYHKTVEQQIKYALRKSKKSMSVDEVVKKFELTPERLGCKVYQLSGERWRASAAIGYAYGKQIFCFPWLDYVTLKEVVLMSSGYTFYADILRREGNIILVPSNEREILEYITDEIIELNNPRFHNIEYLLEYLKQNDFLNKFSDS